MKKIAFATFLLLLAGSVMAQREKVHGPKDANHSTGPRIELPAGTEEISVPFRLVNHHIVLSLTVNGSAPLRIVLDTGMPIEDLALHDSEKTKDLHLDYVESPHVKMGGVGGKGQAKTVRMAEGLTVRIGDLSMFDMRARLMPPMPSLASYSDGMIGAALFRHFAVTLDNDRALLILRRPENYRPPEGATSLPLVENAQAPIVEAKVWMDRPEPFAVRLAVDLGATHVLSLNETEASGIVAPARSLATLIGRGLGGPLTGKVGRIRALELGGLTLQNVVTTFPDKKFLKQRGIAMADGNLGNGALERLNLTVDYAGSRLVLQPAARFKEPFEWDMSGIVADIGMDGTVRVQDVLSDSPASEAGIRENDVIVRIAGQAVSEVGYFELREKLRKDGETVPLELRRGNKTMEVALKLRRLV